MLKQKNKQRKMFSIEVISMQILHRFMCKINNPMSFAERKKKSKNYVRKCHCYILLNKDFENYLFNLI